MGIPGNLTYLLRNLYAYQEAAVRTRHGTTDWFQIRKGVCQSCILSPCLFNFCAKLDESQARIKIAGRNINSLKYADDATLIAESEEELKNFLMRVKEEGEINGLNLNIKKSNIMAFQSHHFTENRRGKSGSSFRLCFLRIQNHCRH